ncbi:MAG: pyridoxal phosphate-dependent aminotransferase [Methanomassiliicoccales archaeon]
MARRIPIEEHVEAISMPENLSIGMMISEQRRSCRLQACPFEYYGFAFGQSPFHVPPPLVEALGESAEEGEYSEAEGIPEVREAIANFNRRHFSLDVEASRVFIGPGTKDLIHLIFDTVQGDVVIPSPSWIGYSPIITLLDKGFHTLHTDPENGYRIDPDDLSAFLSTLPSENRMMVLNNPHNPTGILYSERELKQIAEVCKDHDTLILADEIYGLTTYDVDRFRSMGNIYPEGTFVTSGLSKAWSAGGYRFGYCILPDEHPEELFEAFRKVAGTVYTNVSTPTQHAAVKAFEPNEEIEAYFRITRDIHKMMGSYLSREFSDIDGLEATTPEGSFYFFLDFNQIADSLREKGVSTSNELSRSLISHPHHVAAVTGDACLLEPDDFGARIAFVDYDGKAAFQAYREERPGPRSEEDFVHRSAPRMVRGVEATRKYVEEVTS